MIDVHQNATLSESFEGDRSRVIGNRCKVLYWNWSFCYKDRVFAVVSFAVALDQEQLKIVVMSICSKTMRVVPSWITNNRIIFVMHFSV